MDVAVRNNVTVTGPAHGRPMVFIHGLGCDQGVWRYVAPAFEADHRLVLFDLVGAGGSDGSSFDPVKYSSLQGYADDLLELCHALDLEDVVLVGHSAGAMIGMLAAGVEPERFGALAAIGPSPRYLDDEGYVGGFSPEEVDGLLDAMERNYRGWCDEVPPMFMGNPDRPELGRDLAERFGRGDPEIVRHLARTILRSDHREALGAVTTPTLVLQATGELVAPEVVGRYVHDHLADSELILLRAAGHFPLVSAPAETVAAIHGFLERRARPAATLDLAGESPAIRSEDPHPAPRSERVGDPELEDLYEHAPFGYVTTALDWRISRVNQTLMSWVERDRDELVGTRLPELFTTAGRLYHATHCEPLIALEGGLREMTIDLQRADGSTVPTLISSMIVTDPEGARSIHTSLLDATERQRFERKLVADRRRANRRLRLVQQLVGDLAGAATVVEVGRVLADAAADAFKAAASSLWIVETELEELVELAPTGRTARRLPIRVPVTETEALRSREVVVDLDRAVAAVAAWHQSQAVGVLSLELVDATRFGTDERHLLRILGRQAGQAIDRARAHERRDRLLSVLAHELRTPLTPILGFSEFALTRHPDLSEETRKALQVIKRNGEHLVAIVDDMLSLTRSRRGSLAPLRTEVSLEAFIADLLTDRADEQVEVVVETPEVVARVDAEQLAQIVTNLLSNAHRHGRTPIMVTIGRVADVCTLAVDDQGDGVPPAFVERLFDEFTQADDGRQHSSAGLGLGLAIARELAIANDGDLNYEPGTHGGARFVVSLPAHTP